jgi:hypothetical protein
MSRAARVLVTLLITAGCAQAPADTGAGTEPSIAPHVSGDGLVYRDTGSNVVEVCALVPAKRIGDLFGLTGVEARGSMRPSDGNHVGTCDYTTATFTLSLSVRAADLTLAAEEFVKGATGGRGRPVRGLGDAAALAEYDDGYATLVAVQGELALLLTGAAEHADDFIKVAEEALPGLASLS